MCCAGYVFAFLGRFTPRHAGIPQRIFLNMERRTDLAWFIGLFRGGLFYRAGAGGGGADFLGDFFGLFWVEVKGQVDAIALHIEPHHALICWPDLQIGRDIAF